jgi:hypothetical protein
MLYYKRGDMIKEYEGFSLEEQIERLFGRVCFYNKKGGDIMSSSAELIENKYGMGTTTSFSKRSRSMKNIKKVENLISRLYKLNDRLSKELNILRAAERVNKARKIESAKIVHRYPSFFYER